MGCCASAPNARKDNGQDQLTNADEEPGIASKGTPTKAGASISVGAFQEISQSEDYGLEKPRSRQSRARRLSYVDHKEEAKRIAADTAGDFNEADELSTGNEAKDTAAVKRSKAARRRRLSYVVDEKDPTTKEKLAHTTQASSDPNDIKSQSIAPQVKAASEAQGHLSASSTTEQSEARAAQVKLSMACISRAGREPGFKKQNQDNCFAFKTFVQDGQALFGAFDGHGPEGHTISAYIKQHLPILLAESLKSLPADVSSALKSCFLEVDKAMNATKIDCEFSGSTACVAFLEGRLLNVAWVGDSRGVLGRSTPDGTGFEAVNMTVDHKPTSKDEQARILAKSGRVERLVDESGQPIGPFRVWLQYAWIPGLAMSRALGDALAHQVGVISDPEVFTHPLNKKDAFIILASDGVWEFIDSQAAVNIIGSAATAEAGCRQLVDEAFQRWLVEEEGVVDDITAVVVKFEFED